MKDFSISKGGPLGHGPNAQFGLWIGWSNDEKASPNIFKLENVVSQINNPSHKKNQSTYKLGLF